MGWKQTGHNMTPPISKACHLELYISTSNAKLLTPMPSYSTLSSPAVLRPTQSLFNRLQRHPYNNVDFFRRNRVRWTNQHLVARTLPLLAPIVRRPRAWVQHDTQWLRRKRRFVHGEGRIALRREWPLRCAVCYELDLWCRS